MENRVQSKTRKIATEKAIQITITQKKIIKMEIVMMKESSIGIIMLEAVMKRK